LILVKAFSKEDQEISLYNQRISNVLQLKYKESLAYGLFFGMTGLSGNLIVLSVFYFGGMSMSEESLTIGDLSSFLLYAFWVRCFFEAKASMDDSGVLDLGWCVDIWHFLLSS
jgi:ATP-binding cassette subfamily B (MDR/TAP) protein 10